MIAERFLLDIWYLKDFNVHINLTKQSPDIVLGVDERETKKQGSGDQGIMYRYATNETEELIQAPLVLAHKIFRKYKVVRETNYLHYFDPDGKC